MTILRISVFKVLKVFLSFWIRYMYLNLNFPVRTSRSYTEHIQVSLFAFVYPNSA